MPRALMRRMPLVLWLAAPLMAQPDPGELLLRVREKVMHTVDRLPRYLCTQTVDRSQYEPDRSFYVGDCEDLERSRGTRWKLLLTATDRLRLYVSVAGTREIYSWVGENRSENQSLFDIVNEGAISNGYYQGFLALVFHTDNAIFSYVGESNEGGRPLAEYSYRVPLETSHYSFGPPGKAVLTAYEGTVLADRQTADLVRLTVRTSHLAPETGACEAINTMNFTRLTLRDSDFLLPSETTLHINDLNGVEQENRTVYSGCREYLGGSSIKYEAAPEAGKASSQAAPAAIPAGLRFAIALAEEIPVATAAAGDAVKASLTGDLRDSKNRLLAQKGTPVLCRILRIRRFYYGRNTVLPGMLVSALRLDLRLRLESLGLPGGNVPIAAKREFLKPRGSLKNRPVELGPLDAIGANLWFESFQTVIEAMTVVSGLTLSWVTVAQEAPR